MKHVSEDLISLFLGTDFLLEFCFFLSLEIELNTWCPTVVWKNCKFLLLLLVLVLEREACIVLVSLWPISIE